MSVTLNIHVADLFIEQAVMPPNPMLTHALTKQNLYLKDEK